METRGARQGSIKERGERAQGSEGQEKTVTTRCRSSQTVRESGIGAKSAPTIAHHSAPAISRHGSDSTDEYSVSLDHGG